MQRAPARAPRVLFPMVLLALPMLGGCDAMDPSSGGSAAMIQGLLAALVRLVAAPAAARSLPPSPVLVTPIAVAPISVQRPSLPSNPGASVGALVSTPVQGLPTSEGNPSPKPPLPAPTKDAGTRVISEGEMNVLAALAIMEAGETCPEERPDIAHTVFNRIALGDWGDDVVSVAFAPGQFQPLFGVSPDALDTESEAAAFVARARGMSKDQALAALRNLRLDLANPAVMEASRRHVGGRVFFKGISEYSYRHAEDPLRHQGCNFHHIGPYQTSSDLASLEKVGPRRVVTG